MSGSLWYSTHCKHWITTEQKNDDLQGKPAKDPSINDKLNSSIKSAKNANSAEAKKKVVWKDTQETPVRYPSLDDESNSSIKVVLDPNSAETKNKLAWENTQGNPVSNPSLDDESNSSMKNAKDPKSAEAKNEFAWKNTQGKPMSNPSLDDESNSSMKVAMLDPNSDKRKNEFAWENTQGKPASNPSLDAESNSSLKNAILDPNPEERKNELAWDNTQGVYCIPVSNPSLDDESNSFMKNTIDPNSAETKNEFAWKNTQGNLVSNPSLDDESNSSMKNAILDPNSAERKNELAWKNTQGVYCIPVSNPSLDDESNSFMKNDIDPNSEETKNEFAWKNTQGIPVSNPSLDDESNSFMKNDIDPSSAERKNEFASENTQGIPVSNPSLDDESNSFMKNGIDPSSAERKNEFASENTQGNLVSNPSLDDESNSLMKNDIDPSSAERKNEFASENTQGNLVSSPSLDDESNSLMKNDVDPNSAETKNEFPWEDTQDILVSNPSLDDESNFFMNNAVDPSSAEAKNEFALKHAQGKAAALRDTISSSLKSEKIYLKNNENIRITIYVKAKNKFLVRVPGIIKHGNQVEFLVETSKKGDSQPLTVARSHNDFVWLRDALKAENNVTGVIFPPLPHSPKGLSSSDGEQVQIKIGNHLGYMMGSYEENCIAYTTFLNLCLAHPKLGNSKVLDDFLLVKKPPPRSTQLMFGYINDITKVINDFRAMSFKDANQEFHAIFLHNPDVIKQAEDTLSKSQLVIEKKYDLANSYESLKTKLQTISSSKNNLIRLDRLAPMIQALMAGQRVDYLKAANMQRSLFTLLRCYSGFMDAEQDMFEQRVDHLMTLENIRKTVERKISSTSEEPSDVERMKKKVSIVTEKAKKQMQVYDQQRIAVIRQVLIFLSTTEIDTARQSIAVLKKIQKEALLGKM